MKRCFDEKPPHPKRKGDGGLKEKKHKKERKKDN
jgi:hypothetical protein